MTDWISFWGYIISWYATGVLGIMLIIYVTEYCKYKPITLAHAYAVIFLGALGPLVLIFGIINFMVDNANKTLFRKERNY